MASTMACECSGSGSASASADQSSAKGNKGKHPKRLAGEGSGSYKPFQEIVFSSRPRGKISVTQKFEFIDYNGKKKTPREADQTRRKVKSHVMQQYRRSQRDEEEKALSLTSESIVVTTTSYGVHHHRHHHHHENKNRSHRGDQDTAAAEFKELPSPKNVLSAASTDPFDTSINMTMGSSRFLEHLRCYQVLVQPAIPRKPRDRWFQFAMHHPALLHASLAIAASHWMHLGGSKSEALPVYYHHKIEAIRMVNTSLVDDESAVSDGTIAAIACLAISEGIDGSPETAATHLVGLERLVQLRSKTQSGTASPFLERLCTLARMWGTERRRRGENIMNLQTLPADDATSPPSLQLIKSPCDFFLEGPLSMLPQEVTKIYKELQLLTTFITGQSHNSQTTDSNHSDFLIDVNSSEFYMYKFVHDREFVHDIRYRGPGATWSAYPIAGTVYLYFFLRQVPLSNTIYEYCVGYLKEALEEAKAVEIASERYPPEALFWLLIIGGSISRGQKYNSWFRTHASNFKELLNLQSWDDACQVLEQFVYSREIGDPYFQAFWDELD